MDLNLAGKTALITGGSKGIGAAIAHRLAAEGCDLVLVARGREQLERTKAEIGRESGPRVETVALDISSAGAARKLGQDFPNIDILINNAGEDPHGKLIEIDEDRWRRAWDIKLFGYINMCREYYARMKAHGGGVIVNIIGVAYLVKDAGHICGATSTAAIAALTRTLGGSSLHDGIRVVGVGPGVTATGRVHNAKKLYVRTSDSKLADDVETKVSTNSVADSIAHSLGLARGGRPEEVASLVAYLCSANAGYMTGTIVNTDGGGSRS